MPGKQIFRGVALLMVVFAAATLLIPARAAAQTETILYSFSGSDGSSPESALTFDAAGNLYGTTSYGGTYQSGVVFELSPGAGGTWTEKVLYSFNPAIGDGRPQTSVAVDGAGNVYGTTSNGGTYKAGTAFKLTPGASGWTETILYNFNSSVITPSGLILDGAGNLYGTALTIYSGTVFEFVPNANGGWLEKVIFAFPRNGMDGINPVAGLTFDKAGNLYGTTCSGGTHDEGTVFEMTRTSGKWSEKVIYSFYAYNDGSCPSASVVFDANGNLYGTTLYGLSRFHNLDGTVFELSPLAGGGWKKTTLHEFQNNGVDGTVPMGNLAIDGAGNVYGTTYFGGPDNVGTVYELTPSTSGWSETILHNFSSVGVDGNTPNGGLTPDAAGNLYGTTLGGGTYGGGAVFELTP